MNFINQNLQKNSNFIEENRADICASIQDIIVKVLFAKLKKLAEAEGINEIAIAGGVSANSQLRSELQELGDKKGWNTYIPAFQYCTDNAGMIAITGYHKYLKGEFVGQDITPLARLKI